MSSSDPLLGEDSTPLLDNNNSDTTSDEQDGDGDPSGLVVSNTSSTVKAPLSSETPITKETTIQILDTTTNNLTATTAVDTMDDQKYCRICGEGEDFYDNYNDKQHDDEESLIGIPMIPTTTTMTRQHAPRSGYIPLMMTTGHHSDSTWESTISHNDNYTTISDDDATMQQQQEQHSHLEVPLAPSSINITPTKPRRCSSNTNNNNGGDGVRKRKKWIQQTNPLIRPCHCKGTMMYVHVSCLNRWRAVSPRSTSCVACDLCGYEYNIYRPRYAAIVTNRYFLRFMTVFLVVLATLVCAYLCKLVDMYLLGHSSQLSNNSNNDSDLWRQWHGTSWLGMDLFYLLAGLLVISMLGMVYLTYICVTRPEEVTYLTQFGNGDGDDGNGSGLSFFCCDQTSCPWYTCYLADFAACSGDSAAGGFLIFVVLMSLLAIVFGVFGAVTGIFRMMEYWVDSMAGHLKERILDVD